MIRISYLFVALLLAFPTISMAASFHWVDSEGFHSVDQVTKVPLEHRLELPMVKNRTSLPFTEEEDRDGSMYVWFILNQAGIKAPYTKTADFPVSPSYRKVDKPQNGDVAWWKNNVAIVALKPGIMFLAARGEQSQKTLEKRLGKAAWYRYVVQPEAAPPATVKTAPKNALTEADQWLIRLDKAAEYPLQVKDTVEIERLKNEWKQAIAYTETLRNSYPDDPQVIRRLGLLYRRGFTLDMPGAWERAEAYLLRTTTLAPKSADAFISLGILYGDSDEGLEKQSEAQFRTALKIARKDQLPYIWWGLALALHKQGKKAEALKTLDRLIKQRPKDSRALKLREEFLKSNKGTTEK